MKLFEIIKEAIQWRFKFIKNIIPALILEPKKHPWKLALILFIPFGFKIFYKYYLNQIKNLTKEVKRADSENRVNIFLDFSIIKCAITEENSRYSLNYQYLEIIYPCLVKYPVLFSKPYEKGEVILEKGDVVFDAGANSGIFACLAAKRIGPEGKVYAFEPVPKIRKSLEETVRINRLNNIIIVPFALGDKVEKLKISIAPDNNIGGGWGASSGIKDFGGEYEIVPQITLDNFIQNNNIQKVDFIKMDIEGMERNALRGAIETLRKFKPKLAICIYHLPDDPKIIKDIILEACLSTK